MWWTPLLLLLMAAPPELSEHELRLARSMSPVPAAPNNPTNAHADDPAAAVLGRALFFDPGLSSTGDISCSTCHQPDKAFTDERSLAQGVGIGNRNAPTVRGAAHHRWLFWDGRADTLWQQAMFPIENPLEMDGARGDVVQHLIDTPWLSSRYVSIFGPLPNLDPLIAGARPGTDAWDALSASQQQAINDAFVNVCKSLEAYERQLSPGTSDFDRWVASFDQAEATSVMSDAAIRGFQLFVGQAGCRQCHFGPLVSDLEFHDLGLPAPNGGPSNDPGRGAGYSQLQASPFRADGPWSDAPQSSQARRAANARIGPEHWGAFRTPSLRNVASTGPYMHDGRFETIGDVLAFYNTLETQARRHHHAEDVLQPLDFSPEQLADLEAFLSALSGDPPPSHLMHPPPMPQGPKKLDSNPKSPELEATEHIPITE